MLGKKICGIFILGLGLASGKIINEKTLTDKAPIDNNRLHTDIGAGTNLLMMGPAETSTIRLKEQDANK